MRRGSTIFQGRRPLGLLIPLSAWLLAIAPSRAQQPAAPAPTTPAAATPAAPAAPAQDVTVKYRFLERYAVGAELAAPGALGVYQVGIEDTWVITSERPGAAPVTGTDKYQAVFSERAAGIDSLNDKIVTDVVRRYQKVRMVDPRKPADYKPPIPPYLDGLTLWIKAGVPKKIYSLTEGRRLRVGDFELAQQQVFIPGFAYTLPDIDCRIGDEWPLTATGTFVLLGGPPPQSGGLKGKLLEVRTSANAATKTAIFRVSGAMKSGPIDSAVNAQISFEFTPPPPPAEAAKKAADAVVEARGGITNIILGQNVSQLVGSDNPKQQGRTVASREFRFQRKFQDPTPSLELPKATPQPNEENSWLTFEDPKSRFQFRFPQDMKQDRIEDAYYLSRGSEQDGLEQIVITVLAKGDPLSEPDAMHKARLADLEKEWEVTPGTAAYLPDPDWPKLRVYRWDAILRPSKERAAGGARSALLIGYSIASSRGQAFYVEATSTHEPLLPIKAEVESILHTLTVDVPKK